MGMTVSTWRYHLPSENGEGWAIIFMDSIGCFSALSDWGDYGYRWPEAGWGPGDFRAFFLQCDDNYILRKISRSEVYYGDRTAKNIRRRICELRRGGGRTWTPVRAREEWETLERYGVDSREEFAVWYQHTEIDEAYELAEYDHSYQALAFIARVLPRLREAIRVELAKAAA
jgi:hypothetical protein